MTYQEQIKHPKWQKKRLEILERDDYTCQGCGESEKTLHVHHLIYHKNKNIWEYNNIYLKTYCKECHDLHHEIYDEIKELLIYDIHILSSLKNIIDMLPKSDPAYMNHFENSLYHFKEAYNVK